MGRRVVVTGLGLVSPVGVGVKHAWKNLLNGHCGITSLTDKPEYEKLPVQIAAVVPQGSKENGEFNSKEWLDRGVRFFSFFFLYTYIYIYIYIYISAKHVMTKKNKTMK